ncbi:MAG TPA: hypothetical protein P5227_00955 [Emcibacteraceae bacterium]|nr:hypothetical protein [Emcibacteraceae bacterium]
MIQERVKAGLVQAKAKGKTFGRPKVSKKIIVEIKKDRATEINTYPQQPYLFTDIETK